MKPRSTIIVSTEHIGGHTWLHIASLAPYINTVVDTSLQ
jgi:hypothetical protein